MLPGNPTEGDQMRTFTGKHWIGAAATLAVFGAVWTMMPPIRTSAQTPPVVISALLSNPVGIKGASRSGDVVVPGERAVLTLTNFGDEVVDARMEIRDALNFSRVLASRVQTLKLGEGTSLEYVEQENASASVVGVVLPAVQTPAASGTWTGANNWSAGYRAVLASMLVNDANNATKFVVGTSVMPFPRTVLERASQQH
jgi:hypothetical protein